MGYILTNLIFNSVQSLTLKQLPGLVKEYHMICGTLFNSVTENSAINILTSYYSLRHLWCEDFVWPVQVGSTITGFFYWFDSVLDHYDGSYSLTNISSQTVDCYLCCEAV